MVFKILTSGHWDCIKREGETAPVA